MKTINAILSNEIIIKNSRFISVLFPINKSSNIQELINEVKINYPKATHYCYAYIVENAQKASDDGEPSGTAGIPMLNVLLKENFINVLVITVRYFGGIKLGAGGLVRAYAKSVKEVLTKATIISVEKGYRVRINIPYSEQKGLEYLLRDYEIIAKQYQELVTYEVLIPKDKITILSNYDYKIINEEYIKRS